MTELSIVKVKTGRGGARIGAGRKPGAATKNNGRYVYIIHEDETPGICKIGIANDPIKRLRAHQVSTWRRLKLAAAFVAPTDKAALAIEAAVHQAFWGVHVSGEWFRVEASKAQAEVLASADSMGLAVERFCADHLKLIKSIQDE